MKLVIIGVGRMGMRHVLGASRVEGLSKICLVDISQQTLNNAKASIDKSYSRKEIFNYQLFDVFVKDQVEYDIAIIATTADSRLSILKLCNDKGCKQILIEKPLAQSRAGLNEIYQFVEQLNATVSVNLSKRLVGHAISLKEDLSKLPQFAGFKTITINMGAIGIGTNGIHYLDLLFFLLDADRAKIVSGQIEDVKIKSGRGAQFGDYGGWCTINFYKSADFVGRAFVSIDPESSVFGGLDIVGAHGRIRFNEIERTRIDILRNPDSELPSYRYAADYAAPIQQNFSPKGLDYMTERWLFDLLAGKSILPTVKDVMNVHHLLFDWLEYNTAGVEEFNFT